MQQTRTDYVYGHLLEAITGGLYPNKLDVVREYIQNSYDAIREKIRQYPEEDKKEYLDELKIEVLTESGSLIIFDNAIGMSYETLNEYRKIGFSKKIYGEYAGWRGIGKAAGLSVAEKLIVTTSMGGPVYQLTFNAEEMLNEVYDLRSQGDNIPFNSLIERYSKIVTIDDESKDSFTSVELYKIKPEAIDLLDEKRLFKHLSLLAPVPFDPEFKFGEEIQNELELALDEYTPVNLFVNGTQVFKPYLDTWKDLEGEDGKIGKPNTIPIYDENDDMIAFCWYCMNEDRGQINTERKLLDEVSIPIGGLLYRVDDIKVGDHNLTRSSLWKYSSHLSLYALGEIHVLDERIEPSSDRNDFVDNIGRVNLFDNCYIIAKEISRKARKTSKESRARIKINSAEEKITEISAKIASRNIKKEMIGPYIYQVTELKKEAQKRKPDTPEEDLKRKADRIIKISDDLLEQMTDAIEISSTETKIYIDLTEELSLNEEAQIIYQVIINTLRDFYANNPETFEEVLDRIYKALQEKSGN